MTDVAIFYTSKCSKCRTGLELLETTGVTPEVVHYLKENPDRKTLEDLLAKLEDPTSDIIRRDSFFKANIASQDGFDESTLDDPKVALELLLEYPRLLQRPVIIKGNTAIIGRETQKIEEFLARDI